MLIKQRFCGFHFLLLINLQNSALSLPGAEFFVIEKINRKHPLRYGAAIIQVIAHRR